MNEKSRKEFLDLLAKSDTKTRETSLRAIDGKVDQDHAEYIQEKLSFVDSDMTVRSVSHVSSRTCSFGHLLDPKTRLAAVCEVCGKYTCSTEGCSYTCVRCSRALCGRHAKLHAGQAYCSRCNWTYWFEKCFKKFWGFD